MSDFFSGVQVLKTTLADGTKKILAQLGSVVGEGLANAQNAEWVQHIGFASRPPLAEKGKEASQVHGVRRGGRSIVLGSQDARGLEIYGNLKDGETCVYAPGKDGEGQARALFKDNGSINLYTRKGNKPDGEGILFQIDAEAGAIRMVVGKNAFIMDADGVKITSGAAALSLEADGKCSLIGTGKCQMDGSTVILGSIAAPGVNAVLCGVTGIAGVASTKVLCALA